MLNARGVVEVLILGYLILTATLATVDILPSFRIREGKLIGSYTYDTAILGVEIGDVVWKTAFFEPVYLGEGGGCVETGAWERL